MSLFFVFTIDGDWETYFEATLSKEERYPDKTHLLNMVDEEIKLGRVINNRIVHFVHSSRIAEHFFHEPEFVVKWKEIEAAGGSVAVHCHREKLYKEWHFDDEILMNKTISGLTTVLREKGLHPRSYRGGFLAFSHKLIPILEKNKLEIDFSCEPGRHLEINGQLVADWRGAPANFYRMSYQDATKLGDSKVVEVPLGIYIERMS
ncbi:MAG: hypothetical protein ABIE84_05350, partial [bacterium]